MLCLDRSGSIGPRTLESLKTGLHRGAGRRPRRRTAVQGGDHQLRDPPGAPARGVQQRPGTHRRRDRSPRRRPCPGRAQPHVRRDRRWHRRAAGAGRGPQAPDRRLRRQGRGQHRLGGATGAADAGARAHRHRRAGARRAGAGPPGRAGGDGRRRGGRFLPRAEPDVAPSLRRLIAEAAPPLRYELAFRYDAAAGAGTARVRPSATRPPTGPRSARRCASRRRRRRRPRSPPARPSWRSPAKPGSRWNGCWTGCATRRRCSRCWRRRCWHRRAGPRLPAPAAAAGRHGPGGRGERQRERQVCAEVPALRRAACATRRPSADGPAGTGAGPAGGAAARRRRPVARRDGRGHEGAVAHRMRPGQRSGAGRRRLRLRPARVAALGSRRPLRRGSRFHERLAPERRPLRQRDARAGTGRRTALRPHHVPGDGGAADGRPGRRTVRLRAVAGLMATAQESRWVLGARSETGYVRTANEDRMGFIRTPHGDVYVIPTGWAATVAVRWRPTRRCAPCRRRWSSCRPIRRRSPNACGAGFHAANQAVFERRDPRRPRDPRHGRHRRRPGHARIAAMVAHVGDSRAYLASRGTLRLLTRDHTRVQKMVDAGLLTPAQAADHPDASKLDRAIGHDATVEVDVSGWIRLRRGDMVLLCSDGLSGYVDDTEIGRVLRARDSPQALADRFVDCALAKGGADNVTVQLVRLGPRPGDAPWLSGLGRPAVLGPASALASAVLVWSAGAPRLDAAEARATKLEEELATSREAYAALQQQTDRLGPATGPRRRRDRRAGRRCAFRRAVRSAAGAGLPDAPTDDIPHDTVATPDRQPRAGTDDDGPGAAGRRAAPVASLGGAGEAAAPRRGGRSGPARAGAAGSPRRPASRPLPTRRSRRRSPDPRDPPAPPRADTGPPPRRPSAFGVTPA
ncbi:MAG: hypothetical protein MZW92_29860 [Comamonadaceae bacterium]|nr:hypothetical protein [Comamonadaceae bacterium]